MLSSRMTGAFCRLQMDMSRKVAGTGQPGRMFNDMLDDMAGRIFDSTMQHLSNLSSRQSV